MKSFLSSYLQLVWPPNSLVGSPYDCSQLANSLSSEGVGEAFGG